MTPEEKQARIDPRTARVEVLRLRYFYIVAEQAAIEAELKQLESQPSSSQVETKEGANYGI